MLRKVKSSIKSYVFILFVFFFPTVWLWNKSVQNLNMSIQILRFIIYQLNDDSTLWNEYRDDIWNDFDF